MTFAIRLFSAALILMLGLAVAVDASTAPPHLDTYLALQRARYPQAFVSSGFHDWRTVSQYRSQAGLHYGYDIAMPPGAPAVAGWAGRVVAVAVWTGAEHGVTVLSPSGFEATYGHLVPSVRVGDEVRAGDVVGTVVIDHVDIKMRAPNGAYYDFGGGASLAYGGGLPAAPPPVSREELLSMYGKAAAAVVDAEALVQREKTAIKSTDEAMVAEKRSLAQLTTQAARMKQYVAEGLAAANDGKQAQALKLASERKIKTLRADREKASARLSSAQSQLPVLRTARDECAAQLAERGVAKSQLQAMSKKAVKVAVKQQQAKAAEEVDPQVARMEELFRQGIATRAEVDHAKALLKRPSGIAQDK